MILASQTTCALNGYLAEVRQTIYQGLRYDTTKVLSEICGYSKARVSAEELSKETYLSTENMLPGKGGFENATAIPSSGQVPAFAIGDTLVSNIRPYFKKIVYANQAGGCSGDVLRFHPKNQSLSAFLFCTLFSDQFFEYMLAGAKGTKMPRGDKQQIMNYPVRTLSMSALTDFNNSAIPILKQQRTLIAQNIRLAELRDTLLPKLMSGEISVDQLAAK